MGKEVNTLSSDTRSVAILNSPLEVGVRALALLAELYPQAVDVQRLVFLDYACVHSADVRGGPPSLHTATPFRGGEPLVRRSLLQEGLLLMISRKLVDAVTEETGIYYRASEEAVPFLDSLVQPYNNMLRQRAEWVASELGSLTAENLTKVFQDNLDRWGSEFVFLGDAEEADE